jgi:hypothetical protein
MSAHYLTCTLNASCQARGWNWWVDVNLFVDVMAWPREWCRLLMCFFLGLSENDDQIFADHELKMIAARYFFSVLSDHRLSEFVTLDVHLAWPQLRTHARGFDAGVIWPPNMVRFAGVVRCNRVADRCCCTRCLIQLWRFNCLGYVTPSVWRLDMRDATIHSGY